MSGTNEPLSPHAEIARRIIDGRTSAGAPAVSPDGTRIAFVVATIDLDENVTRSRVWLAGPDGEPAPVTQGEHDQHPTWSPDGRFLTFTSKRGEKERQHSLHVLPVDGPGELRTITTTRDGMADLSWSPDGRWLLVAWRDADQWIFIGSTDVRRVAAFSHVGELLDPGGEDSSGFPRPAGWCCAG